jgi:ADP-ribose pyrophosphatase
MADGADRSDDAGRPFELEIVADERIGEGGFLSIRRRRLRNVRPDGSRSREWICDYVDRDKGVDAVVLVLWRRAVDGVVEVLLRRGLRPALIWGRPPERCALPDLRDNFFFTESVAGIIEAGEQGEEAVRRRAADEALEEAGLQIAPGSIVLLGTGFPSPGMTPERFVFAAAEVPLSAPADIPEGDGSPMEESATIRWAPLEAALSMCRRGEIEDLKTEVGLRRLQDRLDGL